MRHRGATTLAWEWCLHSHHDRTMSVWSQGCHHQQLNHLQIAALVSGCWQVGDMCRLSQQGSIWELVLAWVWWTMEEAHPMQCSPISNFITPNLSQPIQYCCLSVLGNKNPLFHYPTQTDVQQTPQFGWVKRVYGRTPSQNPHCKREKRNLLGSVTHSKLRCTSHHFDWGHCTMESSQSG